MKSKWNNIPTHLYYLAGFFYYIYKLILLIGGVGISFSTFNFFSPQISQLSFYILPMSLVFIFFGIYIWVNITKNQLLSHSPDLKLLSIKTNYCIIDEKRYSYTREVHAKALRHGVEYFKFKFLWTGSGKITPAVENDRQKIDFETDPMGIHRVGKLYFERPLRKNETVKFIYHLDLIDTDRKAKPFLYHNIHYQGLKKLSLTVKFSTNSDIKVCKKQIFLDRSDIPIMEEEVNLLKGREICWKITRPRLGCRYQLRW